MTPRKKYRVLYDSYDFLQTRMDDPPYELFEIKNRTILMFTVFMIYDIFKTRMDGSLVCEKNFRADLSPVVSQEEVRSEFARDVTWKSHGRDF